MKKCIAKAIINGYNLFISKDFIDNFLNKGGYELHFRDMIYKTLEKQIQKECCSGFSKNVKVDKERKITDLTQERTDIICTEGTTDYVIEFGHYTTIQDNPKNAINKPISDIYKWVNLGYAHIYSVNVITHWIKNPPTGYPPSYFKATTLKSRIENLKIIEDEYYKIDPKLLKIVLRPTDLAEMNIYIKGPFCDKDWKRIQGDLAYLKDRLDVLGKNLIMK